MKTQLAPGENVFTDCVSDKRLRVEYTKNTELIDEKHTM